MQAKDIPEIPILQTLAKADRPMNWYVGEKIENSITMAAMPENTPTKVALAKMRSLIKRKLVNGCPCGCRGDFIITMLGRKYLQERS